jgi:ribosomal protein S13
MVANASMINRTLRIVRVDFLHHAAILKALAHKLIPGIAPATRISILQQTTFQEQEQLLPDISDPRVDELSKKSEQSALQYVIESDSCRNDYLREVTSTISTTVSIHSLGSQR